MLKEINSIGLEFRRSLEKNNIRGYAMSLEFESLGKTMTTKAKFASGDRNSSFLAIQLLNNGSPIILEEDMIIYANVARPDSTLITNKCQILDGEIGAILVAFSPVVMEVSGTHVMDITLRYSDDKKTISPKLSFNVFQSNDSSYKEPDESEVNILDVLVKEVITLKESVIDVGDRIIQESEERKVIEAENDLKEAERRLAEEARQNSFSSIDETFQTMHESFNSMQGVFDEMSDTFEAINQAEIIRNEQETQRQQSMENFSQEFLNNITMLDTKIIEFSNNENERQTQHIERKEEFDNIIINYENIVNEESLRKQAETQREEKVATLENRVNSKITELNEITTITNSEIDTIITNALR